MRFLKFLWQIFIMEHLRRDHSLRRKSSERP